MADEKVVGYFPCVTCGCCGGKIQMYYRYNEAQIRCKNCGCLREVADPKMSLRVYADGIPTIDLNIKILAVLQAFGLSGEDMVISQEAETRYFVEIPEEAIMTKLRIEEIRLGKP